MDSNSLQFISGLSAGVGTELQRQQQAQREETARKEQMNFQRQLSENEIQARRDIAGGEQATRLKTAELSESGATTRTGLELTARKEEGAAERSNRITLADKEAAARKELQGLSGEQQVKLSQLTSDLNLRNAKDIAADQEFMQIHRDSMAFDREVGLIELRADLEQRSAAALAKIQKAAELDMLKARDQSEQVRLLMSKGLELHQARELSLIDFKSTLYKAALGNDLERLSTLVLGDTPESKSINDIFAALVDSPATNSGDLAKFMAAVSKGTPASELFAMLAPKLGATATPPEVKGRPSLGSIVPKEKPYTPEAAKKIPKELLPTLKDSFTLAPTTSNVGGVLVTKRPLKPNKLPEVQAVITASNGEIYLDEFSGQLVEVPDFESILTEYEKLKEPFKPFMPVTPLGGRRRGPEDKAKDKAALFENMRNITQEYANEVGSSGSTIIMDAVKTYIDSNGGTKAQWLPTIIKQYQDPKTRPKVFAEALRGRL